MTNKDRGTTGGDPMTAGSKLNELCLAIRKRKGKKEELPALGDYLDKL